MRASILVLQSLCIGFLGSTTVKDRSSDVGKVFAESGILVLDLVGQLAGVAENDDTDLSGNRLELLQCADHKDGGFTWLARV